MLGIIFLLCLKFYISSAVYRDYGTNVDLVCEHNVQSYSWWEKRPLVGGKFTALQPQVGKYNNSYSKTLTIFNLNFQDTGYYRCTYQNGKWYKGQDQLLTVTGKPEVSISHREYSIDRGKDVTLSCVFNSNTNPAVISVWWEMKTSGSSNFNSLPNIMQKYSGGYLQSPFLTIYNVGYTDDGTYRCNVYNNKGTGYADTQLITAGKPEVSILQKEYYIKRGNNVTLPCNIHPKTYPDANGLYWILKPTWSSYFNSIQNNRQKYSGGYLQSPSLTIYNVGYSDDGTYRCNVYNNKGTGYADTQLITADTPTINTNKPVITAKITTSIVLEVNIPAVKPLVNTVNWYKDNQPIQGGTGRYTNGNSIIPSLTINNLNAADDGVYNCTINNNIGAASVSIRVFTWNVPSVILYGNTYVAVGETAAVTGTIFAKPSATGVVWKKRNGNSDVDIDFSKTDKYAASGSTTSPVLTIYKMQESDRGHYMCVASNSHGSGTGFLFINVGEKGEAIIPPKYYISKAGYDIILECIIKTDNSNKNLYWLKDSQNLPFISSRYNGGNLTEPSLTIKKTSVNDAGTYTCKLENAISNSEDTVELKVLSAKVQGQHILNRRANESIDLLCEISGGNTLTWRLNGQPVITTNKTIYSGGSIDKPQLTIKRVTRYHAGNYTCETSYDSVTAISSGFLQLNVQDIPLLHPVSSHIQALTGTNVQITCNHESYQKPSSVFWNKDGEKLNVADSKYNGSTIDVPSLVIFNTRRTDSGKYMCGVVNDIGTGYSKEILVLIKDPEQTSGDVAPVVGGVIGGILALVVVFIFIIVFKRRRNLGQKEQSRSKVNKKVKGAEKAVHYKPDNKDQGEMYINIGRMSSTDTDEDETPSSILMKTNSNSTVKPNSNTLTKLNSTKERKAYITTEMKQKPGKDPSLNHENDDSTYYNIESIITSIKVNDLKEYIFKKQLKEEFEEEYKKIPYGVQHPVTKAQQKENIPKNRFKTTFPYDHTRVVLEPGHGISSDYINANYVDGFKTEKCYIASQGPVKQTINDHWRMIWQNNTRKIIMLTNLVEGPKRKCERYWPEGGKPMTCGNLVLTLLTEKERAAYITREMEVREKKTNEKRCIIQYHFTAWPDHGTPDPLYLVLFHKHVIAEHTSTDNNGPLLVHCSAGIGRTGTYIGLDALYKEGRATGFVDVVSFVKKMRLSRMNMVQTAEQYVCLHYALHEAFTMKDTNVGKEEFGTIWQEIVLDKSPVNRQHLHEEFKMLEAKKSEHDSAQYVAATSPENVKKNRNKSIIPTDNNRLFLTSYDKGRTDYINAVQAPSYTKFVGYLTTQLPLPDTKIDFWTMVRDHNSSTIVVFLNDQAEADLVYSTSKDSFTCGKYSLTITNRGKEDLDVTSCKVILSKKDDKPREIALYLAVSKGLPDPQVLCKLVNLISTRVSMSHDPVSVVSGDGAKNCGVFCTFANAVSSMTIDNNANIFQLARLLQLRRPEFFSDFDEYRLCYEALNLYLESSSVYANF